MKAKILVEETVTKYFDELFMNVHDENNMFKLLDTIGDEAKMDIDQDVPRMNPNLRYSGLNDKFWDFQNLEDAYRLIIPYTGFTGEGMGEPDDIRVWWEFGKKHTGGYNDTLGRDYAYYQEMGVDAFAPNSKVKAPTFEGHHYVSLGLATTEGYMGDYVEEFLSVMLSK